MDNFIINRPNYVSESEMVAVFAVALIMKRRRWRVIKPRIWSRSWVLQRQKQGAYANLCRELEVGDIDQRRIGQVDPPATELSSPPSPRTRSLPSSDLFMLEWTVRYRDGVRP